MRYFCNPNGTRASIVSIQTHYELLHEQLSRYPKHVPLWERPEGESTRQARSGGGRQCRNFRFGTKYGFIKHCAERPCARNLQAAIEV
jgi:hypothetical protein